jgi:lysozyme
MIPRARGIDVNHYHPVRDWELIQDAAISFMGIKATQGNLGVDPTLRSHRDGFRQQPFVMGIYFHYATEGDPTHQAERLLDAVGPLRNNERLALDVEGKTPPQIDWIAECINELAQTYKDRTPILYASNRIWKQIGNPEWPAGVVKPDLWLPRYNASGAEPVIPAPWSEWKIWQWTDGGETGPEYSCPGVGECDADYFQGDIGALNAYAKLHSPDGP